MKSIVTTVVDTADREGRFLSDLDLSAIQNSLQRASYCFEAVEKLAAVIESVTQEAGDVCFQKFPHLKNPGQGADTQEKVDKCYRDIGHYLRLINYCLIVGSTEPLDKWGSVIGIREFYRILNLPTAPYVEAMTYARDRLCNSNEISAQAAGQLRTYFDYLINAFS